MPQIKINPKEWEFEFQQRDRQPILMADLMGRGFYFGLKSEMRLSVPMTDFLFTASGRGYIRKKQVKKIISALRTAIKRESYLQYIVEATKKRVREFDDLRKQLIKEIRGSEISSRKLAQLWEEFDQIFLEVYPWFCIPWYVTEENILSDKVKTLLEKHRQSIQLVTDFSNALLVLLFPTKPFLIQQEQKEFYELVKFAQTHKNLSKDKRFIRKANNYLKSFSWINTFFLLPIEPLTVSQLIRRVNDAVKQGFVEQYELQEKVSRKNRKVAVALIRRLRSDKQLLNLIGWCREYGWLLNWSVEQALITCAGMQPFFKLVAKRVGVPYQDWIHLASGEIAQGLRGEKKFNKTLIAERKKGFVFLVEKGRVTLRYGHSAKKLSDWLDKNIDALDPKAITEIKGQPASSGIVRGKVRRAMIANEARNVKNGEILVCSMTSPDYVPAMNRAAAIVTDEGGLLSHAAIVSREIGKPCIVGTKIATRVLRNGDQVEVNANEGIIKILQHAE